MKKDTIKSNSDNELSKYKSSLGARIKIAADNIGGGGQLSKISGIPRSTLEYYFTGKTEPKASQIADISRITGVSVEYLTIGTEKSERSIQSYQKSSDGFASIPVINVTASAGHGALVLDEGQVGAIAFQEEYLRSIWFVNPKELFCMPVNGESMEPTIRSGEFLLVSKAENHKKPSDGIYIVRLEDNIMVKRIQPLPAARIKISSDNPAYEPFVIDINEGIDFDIIGKVLLVNGLRRV